MALNINGTTGISGVDGSASAPAVTGTDSNTGINFASDTVNINTGGTTRATIDSSGRLLIGTTTEGNGDGDDLTIATSGRTGMTIRSADNDYGNIFFSDGTSGASEYVGKVQYYHADNSMRFGTNANDRLVIDSSGNVLIGVTSTPNGTSVGGSAFVNEDNNRNVLYLATTGGNETLVRFHNSNGQVGVITVSGSSTLYTTSSDYRLKENVVAISDGITRLKTLKPYRFNFKADPTTTVDGFLAHEVTTVPEAISGTKDEVDSDNNPIYQGIDQSKLVPLLTAALQEAIAKIETLETKVAALEAG